VLKVLPENATVFYHIVSRELARRIRNGNPMLEVLLFFLAGIAAGAGLRRKTTVLRIVSRLTDWTVGFMLFVLGVSIGLNDTIIANLPSLGLEGLVLCLGAIVGSLLAVGPIQGWFFREKE